MTKAGDLIKLAYAQRAEGHIEAALQLYTDAEAECEDDALRAHCQRHRGDILRELGQPGAAKAHLESAEHLYRQLGNDPLSLANTLRGLALLYSREPDASALWAEAREIYARLGIAEGVRECDEHLS